MYLSKRDPNQYAEAYLFLRRAVGVLGMALPIVLAVGGIVLFGHGIRSSVSEYYHTGMRDVFVGILCALGIFLLSYKGYESKDDIAGDIAFVSAFGIAWFPTDPDQYVLLDPGCRVAILSAFHNFFSGVFFLTLSYFSLWLFTKTDPDEKMTGMKRKRNCVYRACGYTILISIALIAFYSLTGEAGKHSVGHLKPVFWLEALAIMAFGVSWFVKGETLLMDKNGTV